MRRRGEYGRGIGFHEADHPSIREEEGGERERKKEGTCQIGLL
jgi:hypothetical protein